MTKAVKLSGKASFKALIFLASRHEHADQKFLGKVLHAENKREQENVEQGQIRREKFGEQK